jgi:L-arabinose isomerase
MDDKPVTSFEAAKPGVYGDILNIQDGRRLSPRVGLLAVGYFEYWRMYPSLRERVRQDLDGVHRRLAEHVEVVYPGMVDTVDRAEEAGAAFAQAGVDIVVVVEGTYLPDFFVLQALEHVPHARIVLFNSQTGPDLSPTDTYEDTMRNSALIGIAQLSASLTKAQKPYEVVVGEIADPEPYRRIRGLARAHELVARLRGLTIGLVGHVFRGMFDLEYDKGSVRGRLGPEVLSLHPDHLIELWKGIPPEEVRTVAGKLTGRFKVRGITRDDLERSVRLGLAMRALTRHYRLGGLCFLGQHYIEKMTGAPARLGASMLMEEDRFMVACEGDVGGLVMMILQHGLTGNMPVQMEWGQFDLAHNALFLLGHGIASPEVAAGPDRVTITRAPEEWGFEGHGANWELLLRPGPVTMGHFLSAPDGWRMLISEGEALEFPCLPCDEIHALVRVASPVREYLEAVMSRGVAHHLVVVHGSVAADLEKLADRLGVQRWTIR